MSIGGNRTIIRQSLPLRTVCHNSWMYYQVVVLTEPTFHHTCRSCWNWWHSFAKTVSSARSPSFRIPHTSKWCVSYAEHALKSFAHFSWLTPAGASRLILRAKKHFHLVMIRPLQQIGGKSNLFRAISDGGEIRFALKPRNTSSATSVCIALVLTRADQMGTNDNAYTLALINLKVHNIQL